MSHSPPLFLTGQSHCLVQVKPETTTTNRHWRRANEQSSENRNPPAEQARSAESAHHGPSDRSEHRATHHPSGMPGALIITCSQRTSSMPRLSREAGHSDEKPNAQKRFFCLSKINEY